MAPPPSVTYTEKKTADSHLRSTRSIAGYSVEASDGVIGEVVDFMIDGRTWMIREIVVECGHWYDGKKMMIPTGKASRIIYEDEVISVDGTNSVLTAAALSAASGNGSRRDARRAPPM